MFNVCLANMGVEGVGAGLGTELFCWYCTKSPSTHAIAGYDLVLTSTKTAS